MEMKPLRSKDVLTVELYPGGPVYMSSGEETPEMTLPSSVSHRKPQSAHILSVWGGHPKTPWSSPFPPRDLCENSREMLVVFPETGAPKKVNLAFSQY